MQDTACKLNVKLCHHDLFSVRETTQNKIIGLRSDPAFKGFFNDQLSLTLQIIKEAEPEIIVAINAGVRDIICSEKLFGSMNWDELLGADILTDLCPGKRIPILFSSMISGQRALDRGSYNSLLWHIRHLRRNITQSDCSSYKPERPESPIIDDKPSIHSASTVVRFPCRYIFDGSEIKTYGELSFNIIKRFLIDNPHLTFQTVKNVLPEDARITRLKDLDEKKEKSKDSRFDKRWLTDSKHILQSHDGVQFVIPKGWTYHGKHKDDICKIIDFARKQGYTVEEL